MAPRLTRRSFLVASASAAGLTPILAACNSGQNIPTGSRSPGTAGTATPDSGADTSVPRNQTLVLSVSDMENQIGDIELDNPFVTGAYRTGWHFAYEPLFFYNPWQTKDVSGPSWNRGRNGEIPYLATGYKYDGDYSGITIQLRSGVAWSDGQPFTARDVVFTLNMLKTHAPKLTWSFDINLWVKSVEAPDDHTVRITLNRPNPRFMLSYLLWHQDVGFPMVPEHIWSSQDPTTFTNHDLSKGWPVVTGPWKLISSGAGQKIWERRDDWWGAKSGFRRLPKMRRVVVLPLYESSKLSQLLINNDVDATHYLAPTDADVAVSKNSKLIMRTRNRSGEWGWLDWAVHTISFNDTSAPYSDPAVRWAVSYAVDRDQIAKLGFSGQTQSTNLPFSSYTPLLAYFDKVGELLKEHPVGRHDVTRSGQMMKSAGYAKDSGGFWAKGGTRLSMVIVAQPGLFDAYLPILVAQLRKAGFDASYKTPSNAGTLEQQGAVDAFVNFSEGNSVRDPYDELNTFHSRYALKTGEPAQYPYRWRNPTYDTMIDRMAVLPAPSKEFEDAYHQAMAAWIPEMPMIPIIRQYIIMPVSTRYWKGWPDASNPYCAPSMWHRGSAGLVINTLEPA